MIKGMKSLINTWFSMCFIYVFIPTKSYSRNSFGEDLTLSSNYHYGYVLPEYSSFVYLVNDNVRAISIDIAKKTRGKNDWEQLYNYPEFGISLFYTTLGNNSVYGKEISLNPFFIIDYVSTKKFNLYNQLGVGLNYVTKRFDLENNIYNIAVGSKVNLHFNLRLGAGYELSNKIKLNSGISFDHFSNGNSREPNIGINSLTFYGGLGYRIGNKRETMIRELAAHNKQNHLSIFYSFGGKHARALDTKYYFTSSLSMQFSREVSRIVRLGLGTDLFYDSSTKAEMEAIGTTAHKNIYDFKTGLHLSQAIAYNKVTLELQEGIYLLLTDKVNNYVMYNRGIVSYAINNKLLLRIAMKSHLYILDYPELGIGYKF